MSIKKWVNEVKREGLKGWRWKREESKRKELQKEVLTLLPKGKISLLFPSIPKAADLYWVEKKIGFRIVCSAISVEEVSQWTSTYHSMGWSLVWIVDERRWNKKRVSLAEEEIRKHPSYYYSFSKKLLYDQVEVIEGGFRLFKGVPLPVDIHRPQNLSSYLSLFFAGDLLDLSRFPSFPLQACLKKDKQTNRFPPLLYNRRINGLYKKILFTLLKKTTW